MSVPNRVAAVLIAVAIVTGASCSDSSQSDTRQLAPATEATRRAPDAEVVQATPATDSASVPQASGLLLDTSPIGDPVIDYEQSIAPGQRHLLPMDLHCGMTYLTGKINGRFWVLTESPQGSTPETGAGDTVPPDWPTGYGGLLGQVSITDSEEIFYSLPDGRVIAIYSSSPTEPPGCA